jgi:1-aminocyclopropane-1-carboxylate deaminase
MNLLPENFVNLSAANTQQLHLPLLTSNDIALDVLRLDKIDPIISGNKWFKLKYYLQNALENEKKQVLTFGGAWSNHIIATAAVAKKAGLKSAGIIRGEKPAVLSDTLLKAMSFGMELEFVSREVYNQKNNTAFIQPWLQKYNHPCIIPEGGEGELGVKGAAEILKLVTLKNYTHLLCAVGTGTLLKGIISSSLLIQQVIGVAALKGFDTELSNDIFEQYKKKVYLETGYHMGGYAKKNDALINFMNQFYSQTNIPTDFVYTGKLFFAITDLIKKGYFPKQSRLLAIHSGGLQGNDSLPLNTLLF